MSNLRDPKKRHDQFFQKARAQGFSARSVFKLEEIDKKLRLFRAGYRVLDLGCRPGSWLEYAHGKVGPSGSLVGIDRTPLDHPIGETRNVVGDVFDVTCATLLGPLTNFDVVLSDMAPDTSGVRSLDQDRSAALFERALDLALETLRPGGHFVAKLFMGPDWKRLTERVRTSFEEWHTIKPSASRTQSSEQYVVGLRRKS